MRHFLVQFLPKVSCPIITFDPSGVIRGVFGVIRGVFIIYFTAGMDISARSVTAGPNFSSRKLYHGHFRDDNNILHLMC